MNPASPNLSVGAPRVPQSYVRKFRLEAHEAEGWQIPRHTPLAARVRRRAWTYAGALMAASAFIWAGWQWIQP